MPYWELSVGETLERAKKAEAELAETKAYWEECQVEHNKRQIEVHKLQAEVARLKKEIAEWEKAERLERGVGGE